MGKVSVMKPYSGFMIQGVCAIERQTPLCKTERQKALVDLLARERSYDRTVPLRKGNFATVHKKCLKNLNRRSCSPAVSPGPQAYADYLAPFTTPLACYAPSVTPLCLLETHARTETHTHARRGGWDGGREREKNAS